MKAVIHFGNFYRILFRSVNISLERSILIINALRLILSLFSFFNLMNCLFAVFLVFFPPLSFADFLHVKVISERWCWSWKSIKFEISARQKKVRHLWCLRLWSRNANDLKDQLYLSFLFNKRVIVRTTLLFYPTFTIFSNI